MTGARGSAAILALLVGLTIALRVHLNMAEHGHDVAQALWRIFRFFTLWTNALAGLLMLLVALRVRVSASALSCLTMSMVLVSGVYYALLYEAGANTGLDNLVDWMLHTVIPLGLLLFWLVVLDKRALRWRDAALWQLYPLIYCIYALLRAQIDGIYPYGFIDPTKIGWGPVVRNIAALALVFVATGLAVVALGRRLGEGRA
jgi:hypothetical protein